MKLINIILLIIPIFLFSSCKKGDIIITSEESQDHEGFGNGVWMTKPDGFKTARSYDGFQAKNKMASIEVQVSEGDFGYPLYEYSEENQKKKGVDLKSFQNVKYDTIERAFYAKLYDSNYKRYRYALVVHKNDRNYIMKAFCQGNATDLFEEDIKKSLFSVYIDDYKEKEEEWKMAAYLVDDESVIFTRDGEFPTLLDDHAEIRVKELSQRLELDHFDKITPYFKEIVKKVCKTDDFTDGLLRETLINGKFISHKQRTSDSLYTYIAILVTEDQNKTQYLCTTTEPSMLKEFEGYIKANLLRLVPQ